MIAGLQSVVIKDLVGETDANEIGIRGAAYKEASDGLGA